MRRLALAVAAVLVLLLVLDRVAVRISDDRVAQRVQAGSMLREPPQVDLEGFPFLTQAVRGRYERIVVTATDVPADGLTLARLDAVLRGAQLSLGDALNNRPVPIPVEELRARVLLSYDQLTRTDGTRELSVTPRGDQLRLQGEVEILGQTLRAAAVSRVEVVDGQLRVTAESFEVGNRRVNDLLTRALRGVFDFDVPLRLPYDLELQEVQVGPDGLVLEALGRDVVLPP